MVPLTKDELAIVAERWLGIVQDATEKVMAAEIAIYKAQDEIEEASRRKLTEFTDSRRSLFNNYATIVSAWEKKGGDPELIADYRAYQSAIIIEETRTADYKTLLAQAQAWALSRDGGVEIAIDVLVVVSSLIGLLFFARIIRRIARRYIGHIPNISLLLQTFLVTVVYWLVIAVGLMIVLSALGIDISPLFALVGGASLVLAFAFQESLGNVASGLMIMINRPFDQGHYVDIGGVGGTVKSVNIVSTTIVTPDNQVIVIRKPKCLGKRDHKCDCK